MTAEKKKTGRPPTGSIQFDEALGTAGEWTVRCTRKDGTRTPPIMMPGIAKDDVTEARRMAAVTSQLVRERGVGQGVGETLTDWMDRWFADRELRGLTSVADDRSHYKHHVAADLGTKDVTAVSRADLEGLIERLDRKVRESVLSWKTAMNVWATMSKAFSDAANAKSRSLRVREGDNPAKDVRGPDRGTDRAKQFLYPSEFLTFVGCPIVPLKWKRAVTIAIYMFPRDGEERVLPWDDNDLDHGSVHIHQAWDRRAKAIKSTKTKHARRFNVERELLPLLEAMYAEAKADVEAAGGDAKALGRRAVVEMPSERDMSRGLKRWLKKAGVTRKELFADTATTKSLTWHDLRATGLTWMAVRGDDPLKIMQRAGHERFETTQGYIREAENVRDGFGEVFPPLPGSLLDPTGVSVEFRFLAEPPAPHARNHQGSWRGGRDSNPRPPA